MGLFNELVIDEPDAMVVQFKHGMLWQYKYRVGDRIAWDHLQRPKESSGTIVVPGLGTSPDRPEMEFYAIVIIDDVIQSARAISEAEYESLQGSRIGDQG